MSLLVVSTRDKVTPSSQGPDSQALRQEVFHV